MSAPSVTRAADTAVMVSGRAGLFTATKTWFYRGLWMRISPSSMRSSMDPSTYHMFVVISLMSLAFTTFGWTSSLSQHDAISFAAGVASPACPPMLHPIPVGTMNTPVILHPRDYVFANYETFEIFQSYLDGHLCIKVLATKDVQVHMLQDVQCVDCDVGR